MDAKGARPLSSELHSHSTSSLVLLDIPSPDSPTVFCLWLLPTTDNAQIFSAQIEDLSEAHNPSPIFDPHITFLSGFNIADTDLEEFKRKTAEGLKRWKDEAFDGTREANSKEGGPVLHLPLERPIAGETYYTAIVYPVKQDSSTSSTPFSKLLTGRHIVEEIFNKPNPSNRPFFPHLSLMYSDEPQSRCEEIKDKFLDERKGTNESGGGVQQSVKVGSCVVVRCQGTADEWKIEAEYGLDGRQIR